MNRITKKREDWGYELAPDQGFYTEEAGFILTRVVGQYEDVEEELGIDLMTLLKALTDGFYFINIYGLISYTRDYLKPVLDAYGKNIEIQEYVDNAGGSWYKMTDEYVRLSDYGKTWALTKEELIYE